MLKVIQAFFSRLAASSFYLDSECVLDGAAGEIGPRKRALNPKTINRAAKTT